MKPGVGWLGSSILNVITLGSESIRDNAYAAATMEPTSVPSLMLYLVLLVFLSIPIFSLLLPKISTRKVAMHLIQQESDAEPTDEQQEIETADLNASESLLASVMANKTRLKRTRVVAMTVLGLALGMLYYRFAVMNQSVLIWRAFNSDMRSCACLLYTSPSPRD